MDEVEELKPRKGRTLQNARIVRAGVGVVVGSIIGITVFTFVLMMIGYIFGDIFNYK